MSPIDDELRAALHGRAQVLAPSPDPLAGIERRAKRIQRNRVGAAVAGSALAVAMIAVAVPVVLSGSSSAPDLPRYGTQQPSAEPTTASSYALDPAAPWAYRGDATVLEDGNLETIAREWGVRHRMAEPDFAFSPLYGELYEPSQQTSVFFVGVDAAGQAWWGVAQSSESGPEFLVDEQLADDTLALPFAAPGDEVARLLVVASPEVGEIQYGHDDASEFDAMESIAEGVAVTPLDGDLATDSFRVLDSAGDQIHRAPAPDPAQGNGDSGPTQPADAPDNLLNWGFRGQEDPELEARAVRAYAESKSVAPADVGFNVLFSGNNDPGQRFTVLQTWTPGRPAQIVGFVDHPDRDDELVLQPLTDPDEPVVALLLTETPGRTVDELVVIPTPATGQVMYAADGQAEARPVESAPGLDGVVLIDRERGADADRLTVLDGDGDLDNPLYRGTVADLLCGETGCS